MDPPTRLISPIPRIEKQQDTNLCWAAVSHMVVRHYGNRTTQSELVCGRGNITEDPLAVIPEYIQMNRGVSGAPDEYVITTEINANRPIIIKIGGHYILLIGYYFNDKRGDISKNKVVYIDPNNEHNYVVETGARANTFVHVDYTDKKGANKKGPESINGYYLTKKPVKGGKSVTKKHNRSRKNKRNRKNKGTRKHKMYKRTHRR